MSLAEVVFAVFQPSNLLLLFIVLGVLALPVAKWTGFWLAFVGTAGIVLATLLPVGDTLLNRLEHRVVRGELGDTLTGIIVLGGFVDLGASRANGATQLVESAERLTEAAILAREYPQAVVIVTDGGPARHLSGAEWATETLVQLGVPRDRIVVEPRATSTYENAVFALDAVSPAPADRFALITSGYHMPRSVSVFRVAGWPEIVPIPVDYVTAPDTGLWQQGRMNVGTSLMRLDAAAREYAALAYYYLLGRTDAPIPVSSPAGEALMRTGPRAVATSTGEPR